MSNRSQKRITCTNKVAHGKKKWQNCKTNLVKISYSAQKRFWLTVLLSIPHNKLPWLNDVNPTNTWHHKRHSIPNEFEGDVPTRFQCPYPNCRLFCVGNIGIGLWPPNILWPKILIRWVFFSFSHEKKYFMFHVYVYCLVQPNIS